MTKNIWVEENIALSVAKRKLFEKFMCGEIVQESADGHPIPRRPPGALVPLSPAQEQIWSAIESDPSAPPYFNESVTIRRRGPLDVFTLERSFTEIIRRHEAWRTTFQVVDGRSIQVIHEAPEHISLPFVDLSHLPEIEREKEAMRLATEDATRAFNVSSDSLVRARLVTLNDEEHCLFLTMHQLIVDGVSVFRVLPAELVAHYEAFVVGRPSPLPELPIQFGDFACWQRKWFSEEALKKQIDYWRSQLRGHIPALDWPKGVSRPKAQTFRGAIYPKTISKDVAETLRARSQEQGVTLFMTLLAGFSVLLHFYSGQDDITIGTLTPSGRDRSEVQDLLGYFLNPLPLRFHVHDHSTYRDLLWQAREVTSAAIANDDVPFHQLVKELQPVLDRSRNPFFQVALSLAPELSDLGTGWAQTFMDIESGGAKWDLYLEFGDRPEGIIVRAQYNPDILCMAAVQKMLDDLEAILVAVTSCSLGRISELPLA
jgi:hypothetical protein